jgi:serine/threonine-protein kinase HipA
MTDLTVELYGHHVGVLHETRDSFDFVADVTALRRWGLGSTILSFAVPLTTRPRSGDAKLRRNFFDEILPEGRARSRLAGNARISSDYTVGMLARYGRDVAGALKIYDPSAPGEPRTPATLPASPARVRELLEEVASAPLGNDSVRRMSSLAGVQDKIVLARVGDGWAEPVDGFPSTHILKPVVPLYPSLIFDEEYGARIARHLSLTEFDTYVSTFDGVTALVIERYDRSPLSPDGRIHQEDFNQILGMTGDGKYEEDGHPGLRAIARVVRAFGTQALSELLTMTTMSLAIGNLDMHGKNISVLHLPDGSARLAPAYDIVPQTHQPFDQKLALYINGKSDHADVTVDDLITEARSWGIRSPESTIVDTITSISGFVAVEHQLPGAHFSLDSDIEKICANLLAGRGANPPSDDSPESTRTTTSAPGGWGGPVRP